MNIYKYSQRANKLSSEGQALHPVKGFGHFVHAHRAGDAQIAFARVAEGRAGQHQHMGFFQNTLTGLGACKPCRPHTGEQVNAAPRRAEREPRQLPDALCAIGHARGKFRHDLRSKLFAAAQRVQRGALGGRGRGIYHAVVDAFHRPRNGLRRYNVAHAEARHHKILAEAVVRGWISGNAQTYYEKGIRASFSFYETHAKDYAGYLNENAVAQYLKEPLVDFTQASGTEEQIERIIMQKYLVTFYQGNWDSFYEQLRTGYPDFRRPAGTEIPKRWMYPQGEYDNNGTNVETAITRQFGAGNDKINQATWWQKKS